MAHPLRANYYALALCISYKYQESRGRSNKRTKFYSADRALEVMGLLEYPGSRKRCRELSLEDVQDAIEPIENGVPTYKVYLEKGVTIGTLLKYIRGVCPAKKVGNRIIIGE